MERLINRKNEREIDIICRHEECDTDVEHCPNFDEYNCPCLQDVLKSLAEYENLEEQGKLPKLPCVVGDITYSLSKLHGGITEAIVKKIEIDADGFWVITSESIYSFDDFGKTVFLTKEEAEAALKK